MTTGGRNEPVACVLSELRVSACVQVTSTDCLSSHSVTIQKIQDDTSFRSPNIDQDLFRFEEIWAAAGHPHGVFKLRPQDLAGLTGGAPVADVVVVQP